MNKVLFCLEKLKTAKNFLCTELSSNGGPSGFGQFFTFSWLILLIAFCYTIGYFDLYRIPEAPGVDQTLAFYLRSIFSSALFLASQWKSLLVHLLILLVAVGLPRFTQNICLWKKGLSVLVTSVLLGWSAYWLGGDPFEVRIFPRAFHSVLRANNGTDRASSALIEDRLIYASESGIYYWLTHNKFNRDIVILEGISGDTISYSWTYDADQLKRLGRRVSVQ